MNEGQKRKKEKNTTHYTPRVVLSFPLGFSLVISFISLNSRFLSLPLQKLNRKGKQRTTRNQISRQSFVFLCSLHSIGLIVNCTNEANWIEMEWTKSECSFPFFIGKKNQIKGTGVRSFLFLTAVHLICLFTCKRELTYLENLLCPLFSSYFGLIYNGLNRKREIRPNKKKIKHTIHSRPPVKGVFVFSSSFVHFIVSEMNTKKREKRTPHYISLSLSLLFFHFFSFRL